MTKEEYKAKKELLDEMIKDARHEVKTLEDTPPSIIAKAFYQSMIKELQIWKDIIKDDYKELK